MMITTGIVDASKPCSCSNTCGLLVVVLLREVNEPLDTSVSSTLADVVGPAVISVLTAVLDAVEVVAVSPMVLLEVLAAAAISGAALLTEVAELVADSVVVVGGATHM